MTSRLTVGFDFEEYKDLVFYSHMSGINSSEFIRTAVRFLVRDLKELGVETVPYARGVELLDEYFARQRNRV